MSMSVPVLDGVPARSFEAYGAEQADAGPPGLSFRQCHSGMEEKEEEEEEEEEKEEEEEEEEEEREREREKG